MKSVWKVLGWIGLLVVVVFAGGIGKLVGKFTGERFLEGKQEAELDSILMQTASQLNQNLPMMVDAETRLDSTVGINKQIRYNYTMINYPVEKLDAQIVTEAMQPNLINYVCTTKEMEVFRKNDIPVAYAYYGKNGKYLMTITVQPSQCESS